MTEFSGPDARRVARRLRLPIFLAGFLLALSSAFGQFQYFPGLIKRELFQISKLPVSDLSSLAGEPTYPLYPAEIDSLTSSESPKYNVRFGPRRTNFGLKLSGFIAPTNSADYVFYLAGSNQAEFWLSSDESPTNITAVALEPSGAGLRDWTGTNARPASANLFPGQRQPNISLPTHLVGGQRYYFQLLTVDASGRGYASVAWVTNGSPDPAAGSAPIQSADLGVIGPTNLTIVQQPSDVVGFPGSTVTFRVAVEGNPRTHVAGGGNSGANYFINWFLNGRPIGFNNPFVLGPLTLGQNGSKIFAIAQDFGSGAGNSATSSVVTLTVPQPTNGPVVTGVSGASDLRTIVIRFSHAMDPATAANANNYQIVNPANPSGFIPVYNAVLTASNIVTLTTIRLIPATRYTLNFPFYSILDTGAVPLQTTSESFVAPRFISGLAVFERWDGFSGSVGDLITNVALAGTAPSLKTYVSSFESPPGVTNQPFGAHLSADFLPAATADYVFFVAATNQASFFLSPTEFPEQGVLIAEEPSGALVRQWTGSSTRPNGENRSDKFPGGQWPTRGTITLAQGAAYHLDLYYTSTNGAGYAGATFKTASEPDPSDGGIRLLGDVIRSAVSADVNPPVITTRPVGQHYNRGDTVTLSVSSLGAPPLTYYWYHNKKWVPTWTNSLVTIVNADVSAIGDYYCVVSNLFGVASSYPDDDARLLMTGAFVVEAEDYNFGGGQSLIAASSMPLTPGLYQGMDGLPQVDFRLFDQSSTNPAAGGNQYRNGWVDGAGVVQPFGTEPWDNRGNVDIFQNFADSDRGDFAVLPNYRVSSRTTGEYFNYTRAFPPGKYNVVLGVSSADLTPNAFSNVLQVLRFPPSVRNADTAYAGQLVGDGTGAFGSNDLLPYTDPNGTPAVVDLYLGSTVQVYNFIGGAASPQREDLDFLLFYPVGGLVGPTITIGRDTSGVLTLFFSGTLQSSPSPDGPWSVVTDATSPYQPDPAAAATLFFRSAQ
jgi:Immunoglobulin domain